MALATKKILRIVKQVLGDEVNISGKERKTIMQAVKQEIEKAEAKESKEKETEVNKDLN